MSLSSDNYQLSKSSEPQGVSAYTPFEEKQWYNIPDINSGVYSNNSGLTQVQFDLTSIFNSSTFTDTSDLFLTVPIIMTAVMATSAGASISPQLIANASSTATSSQNGYFSQQFGLVSLKSNYQHLVHQVQLEMDGKVVHDTTPFLSVFTNFRLLSQMSTTDLAASGPTLGFSTVLDNHQSAQWMPAAGAYLFQTGVGLCNNVGFLAAGVQSAEPAAGASQNSGSVNTAITRRISRMVDTTQTPTNSFNKLYGTAVVGQGSPLMSATQLQQEFRPYYTITGNVMVWYDLAILPLRYLCDVCNRIGLVRRLNMVMRLYFNTGSILVPVTTQSTAQTPYVVEKSTAGPVYGVPTSSTFPYICPITVNYQSLSAGGGGLPTTCFAIAAGVFIAKAPTTSISFGGGSINIGLGVGNHPMPSCRMYYSSIKLEPEQALAYVSANTAKEVVFEQCIQNFYSGITAGSTVSQLVQSGVRNPLGVAIIPFISNLTPTTSGGTTALGITQYGSPYDTCPATYSPVSLTNVQVQLGGQNVLSPTLFYTFESFLEQVALADSLTSADLGIAVGLISQTWWETIGRVYWVDLKRGSPADKATPRSINVSFTNNSLVTIDYMVFTCYADRIVVNVENGLCRRM